jgi:xylan 1,4-beta-xylosidase
MKRVIALFLLGATFVANSLDAAEPSAGKIPKDSDWRQYSWAKGIEGQRKADLGDGRFLNPILAGDHADPTVLKDGADYYMVHSSFDSTPGLLIWL